MTRLRALVAGLVSVLVLSSCGLGSGLYNVPLPGGADLGSHPYKVTAVFTDVLDLVPQSSVKVNNVAVGRVSKITVEDNGRYADVVCEVNGDVKLPANATASILQTSLLGEKYVALIAPPSGTGQLRNGARITSTSTGVEAEQVLGALSLLLSGGGIAQLNDITVELNRFAKGNEGNIRAFLENLQVVTGQLDAHKDSITRALDALATLSGTLDANTATINNVLATLPPGIAELARQRDQLITMLTALNNLSTVTVHVLDASQQQFVADLQNLGPILKNLAAAGAAFPQSLQALLTYPFTDAALTSIKGDYINGWVRTAFNTTSFTTTITVQQWLSSTAGGKAPSGQSPSPTTSLPTIPPPPSLLPTTSSVAPGVPASSITSTGSASTSASPSTSASSVSTAISPPGSTSATGGG
jgi:phospholipid/cholesterol/gamma-HCH transport system substrate-binding protein